VPVCPLRSASRYPLRTRTQFLIVASFAMRRGAALPRARQQRRACGVMVCSRGVCRRPFRVVKTIARGAMGQVYQVHDGRLRLSVALKAIRPELLSATGLVLELRLEDYATVLAASPTGRTSGESASLEMITGSGWWRARL
jgi:hypothetical protein